LTESAPEPLKSLVARVAQRTGVTSAEIMSHDQRSRVATARHIVAWILYDRGYKYEHIGDMLHRDHSAVIYGVKKINKAYIESAQTSVYLDELAKLPVKPAPVPDEAQIEAYIREWCESPKP
jgi:chromosomal replication initiation ATPase DnaA